MARPLSMNRVDENHQFSSTDLFRQFRHELVTLHDFELGIRKLTRELSSDAPANAIIGSQGIPISDD